MTKPLICYALAPDIKSAQQCAWDLDFAPEQPEDAEPYRPEDGPHWLYKVTITAERVRAKGKVKL
jgi:hypothetical protein